jgi:hypothetical protein
MPPSNPDATQSVTNLLYYTKKHSAEPLKNLIRKINSTEGLPPVSVVLSDGIMCFSIKVARELGLPEVQFWTASACGLMAYIQFVKLVSKGIFPLKDEGDMSNGYLESLKLEWIPGMENMRLKDMPSFVRSTDPEDIAFNRWLEEGQDNLKADGIIINTFDEFEYQVLEALSPISPPIYNVGPLLLLADSLPKNKTNSIKSTLWTENTACLDWLDNQPPNSVVYVNFGSIAVMTEANLAEFAWGLAGSGHSFLWVLRGDVVMGSAATLTPEFIEETKGRGMIVSWCPQIQVLAHPSVAVFLTHSGWNSTVEGICGGVSMLCWPFFAEQQVNCRFACTAWGIGMEIDSEVTREQVSELVKEMIEGDEGKKMKKKAMEWKQKAKAAVAKGGSAYNSFNQLADDLLQLSLGSSATAKMA